ncbi:hypothetical protein APUTEX25_000702, partial [Auxenochlorella protothecoides]
MEPCFGLQLVRGGFSAIERFVVFQAVDVHGRHAVFFRSHAERSLEEMLDRARVEIPGACEPDFVEATLAGRAFVDENGDGFAGPDEAGLAGAMVALSAGVDARTDAMGHYHITCLAPGRHAIKLDPPPTHPACSLGRCL